MPTYEGTPEFWRDYHRLTPAQRRQFLTAVKKLVYDLKTDDLRAGLRMKEFRRGQGMYEITWAPDGRALFRYGDAKRPGDKHVIWHRVGTHGILDEP
jgi:hypothetical protein